MSRLLAHPSPPQFGHLPATTKKQSCIQNNPLQEYVCQFQSWFNVPSQPKLHLSAKDAPTLSTEVFCRQTMFAVPMSPPVENFTPSFVTEITTARNIKTLSEKTKTKVE